MRWSRTALGLLAASMALAAATPARATYYDLYGFTPRTIAMGGAMTAAVRDYAATFYNPAALTIAKQGHVGLVGHLRAPALYVDRQEPGLSADHPTAMPELGGGASLGWAYPMGGIFDDRLAIGVSLHLPVGRLVRVQGVDRVSPQFYMYQNLHDKLMLLAAVGFEPVEWLSVGAAIQVLADLTGGSRLQLDIVDGRFERREFSVDIRPTASANIGVHVRPFPGFAVGCTWRGSSSVRFDVPVTLSEGDALDLRLDVSQVVQFTPHHFALGFAYTVPSMGLTLATDATLSLWSLAPDPSPQLRVDVGGDLLTVVGLGEALDVAVNAEPLEMGFVDTVTLRAGVEWAGTPWLQLRGGYSYRPTPAPRQTGASAYLDNDAHVLSVGTGFSFFDPLEVHAHPLTIDLSAQVIILPGRAVSRPPGDLVGSLRHGGQIWSIAASVSHAY